MIFELNDKEHFVLLPVGITKEKFLSNAKVKKDSYFYRLLEKIYIVITNPTVDVSEEYSKYYSEYQDLDDYLYHRYPSLSDLEREKIFSEIDGGEYTLKRGYMRKFMDYNVYGLFDIDDSFLSKVNDLLKADKYED